MYRWFQLLEKELKSAGIDAGMASYVSCSIEEQRRIFSACSDSPLFLTGSRAVAAAIKELLPNTFASTGGPNTMVNFKMSPKIQEAMVMSTLIENSGQCTALRHVVTPKFEDDDFFSAFENSFIAKDFLESLEKEHFFGLFPHQQFQLEDSYKKHPKHPIAYRKSEKFPTAINENWRSAYLDVTIKNEPSSDESIAHLAQWLNHHQPISLAINGDVYPYTASNKLFEQSSLCVYTIGHDDAPALTAQARPQDGEIFGELPPRKELGKYSKFPVFVPSSTPSNNSVYSHQYLISQAKHKLDKHFSYCNHLLGAISSREAFGFAHLVVNYLAESCGPKRGVGNRTSLFGLQTPPLLNDSKSVIRCEENTSVDSFVLSVLPFFVTNARSQVIVSCDPANKAISDLLNPQTLPGVEFKLEDSQSTTHCYNVIFPEDMKEFPMVGNFVSLFFPFGHIKSTKNSDEDFVKAFSQSKKWLSVVHQ